MVVGLTGLAQPAAADPIPTLPIVLQIPDHRHVPLNIVLHPERNWSVTGQLQTPAGPVEDNVPEDTAVVVNAPDGLIVISGCGHAGPESRQLAVSEAHRSTTVDNHTAA
jgi:metal-dependent hydrolase (beta-lactamase superfamily II)